MKISTTTSLTYKISSMLDLNQVSIQAGLRMSLERFSKIREIVQTEAEEAGLGKKTLGTNQMRKELDNLAEKIRERVKKHINNNNVTWTREALLRLIYIEKKNVARRKAVKESSDRGQPIPMRGRRSSARVVTPKHDTTVDDQHPKSPKNVATGK